jgi:hypothetical protein
MADCLVWFWAMECLPHPVTGRALVKIAAIGLVRQPRGRDVGTGIA